MPNPFYNKDEQRLRALVRIILHAGILLLGTLILAFPVSILLVATYPQPPTPEELQNSLTLPTSVALITLVVMTLTLWLFARVIDKRRFSDYGLWVMQGAWWRDLAFGLGLGAGLMALVFGLQLALGWVQITDTFAARSAQPFSVAILAPIITFLCVGIYEEMLSRGYHLLNLAEGLNLPRVSPRAALLLAWVLSSSLFGVLHAFNPNATPISTFNLMLAGLFLGLGFVLTRSLAIPIGLHISWNFFQGNVFGFPVSGTNAGATFIAVEQGGPALITGGAFGPEAGLIGLAVIALGVALTVAYVQAVYGEVRLQTELTAYTPRTQPEKAETHKRVPAQEAQS